MKRLILCTLWILSTSIYQKVVAMARLAGKVPRDTVTVTVELGSPSQFVPTSIPFGLSSQSLHISVVGVGGGGGSGGDVVVAATAVTAGGGT
jgi:hypothetical protein